MSERRWTPEQQRVINLRDCNILVSAAAGSGKTAVLVERILSRIMDKENPINVDQFIIVTFTKAAAAEMRERIGIAIDRAVADNPGNLHLQQQVALLHHAQISTIHSFCGYVIQNYFHRIGVDPSYRLGNETEMAMVQSDVLADLLEENYQDASPDFVELAESYLFDKNDHKLEELVMQIYKYAMSNPWPEKWFASVKQMLKIETEEELEKSELVQGIIQYTKKMLAGFGDTLEQLLTDCACPPGPYMYVKALQSDLDLVNELEESETYDEIVQKLNALAFARLSGAKSDEVDVDLKETVKQKREVIKTGLKALKADFYDQTLSEHLKDIKLMAGKLLTLVELTEEFALRYQYDKKDKGLADFNDLEQMAISILLQQDEEGNMVPTEAADELAHQFEEIMIDEYQDSNLVQDTLLRSVSRERYGKPNIFMVGDVKQSIYRFRLARPELFTQKMNEYADASEQYQRVDLHKNFRSRGLVLDCVNQVFASIMKRDLGGIEYDDKAALYVGAQFPEEDVKTCEDIEVLGIDDEDSSKELEATVIAKRIKELVNPQDPTYIRDADEYRPAHYHDIVILVRSAKGYVESIERVLQAEGIPINSEKKEGFYQTMEIRMMVNMFRVLDNPRQDIPLVAVLRGPMFGFTDDELAVLRGSHDGIDFYDNLLQYDVEGELRQKVQQFLTELQDIRSRLSYATVADVIRRINQWTRIYDKVMLMNSSARKIANLDLLMKLAVDYDGTSYHGLFQFVRYLSYIENHQFDEGEANIVGENDDAVRIVTIHKSKGLEYPICILAGMGRRLGGGRSAWLFIHPEYGLGAELIDNENRVRRDTITKKFVQRMNHMEDMGEELRVLYVAMTRAKEKLIFTGAVKDWEKKCAGWQSCDMTLLDRVSASNYFGLVMPVFLAKESDKLHIESFTSSSLVLTKAEEEVKKKISQSALYNFDTDSVYDDKMKELLDFTEKYEYQGVDLEIPVKVSVSDLKKKSLEEDEMPSFHVLSPDVMEDEAPIPAFARETQEETQTPNRGALYGTIWHQFMAVADFTRIQEESDIAKQVTDLIARGKMNADDCQVLNTAKLWKFFQSSLGERMTHAMEEGRLFREQPFVLGVEAREALPDTDSDEMVLVQGIIDGFLEEEDGLVLMDYKTDSLPPGGEQILISRYHVQMEFYQKALERITGKKVKESILYSFSLGKCISL